MDKAEQNASRADKAIRRFLGPEECPVDPKAAIIKGANDLLVLVQNKPPRLTFVIIQEAL